MELPRTAASSSVGQISFFGMKYVSTGFSYERSQEPMARTRRLAFEGLERKELLSADWGGASTDLLLLDQQMNEDVFDALHDTVQKQQQYLQMISNISKMLNDTSMAAIRKIQ
jgi:hypothetical protein